jgi:uncharacterized protein (TIGR03545 family)
VFRWRAIVPLLLFLALVVGLWVLLLDRTVRRAIEDSGTEAIGARVELAEADVRLARGELVLRGLQVTNPNSPMRNLFEVREIVGKLNLRALLEKKIVVDTLAVRDVRFGTARATSGAVPQRSPATGAVWRQVDAFVKSVPIPTLSLEGLAGQAVNLGAISADSLRTPAQARVIALTADSLRRTWESDVASLDPRPLVDSAESLIKQVQTANPLRLGPVGVANLVTSGRGMLERLDATKTNLSALTQTVAVGVDTMRARVAALDGARREDYAYARSLVRIPSLNEPEISPALFGDIALDRLKPVLYWLGVAERYLPPGLDPRRRPGPDRPRLAGSTARFPRPRGYPSFLLRYGEVSLAIGGTTAATGAYVARIAGLTTEPSLYGSPFQFVAERTAAAVGPTELRIAGALDHTTATLRDSVSALAGGFPLPRITVGGVGAQLDLGLGVTRLSATRSGSAISARWIVRAPEATWTRTDTMRAGAPAPLGSPEWAEDFLWRSVAGVRDVRIEAWLTGSLEAPAFGLHSNVGEALAASLRRELGAEIARVETELRAQVDGLIGQAVEQARSGLETLEMELLGPMVTHQQTLEALEESLAKELQQLTRGLPGIPIP